MASESLASSQFRLRHAAIGVTVAAVILAIAAPRLRMLSAEQWSRTAMAAAVIGLTALGAMFVLWQLRAAAAAKAGTIRHRASVYNPMNVWICRTLLGVGLFNSTIILGMTANGPNGLDPPKIGMAISAGFLLACALWNPLPVAIADDGLVISMLFYPWQRLRYEGTDEQGDVHVKLKYTGTFYIRCASEAARQMIAEKSVGQ